MDYTWSNSRLRYIDAGKLQHSRVDFDGLDVRDPNGQKLGDVEGFVFEAATSRPYYIVVDSGGWFSSRHFLLPIGHAALDSESKALVTDVNRDAVARFPTYEPEQFGTMNDEGLRAFQQRTIESCCPADASARSSVSGGDEAAHFRQPEWWDARFQPAADLGGVTSRPVVASDTSPLRDEDRERVVAHHDDSPHYEGRAQPGDVLGIETGGERTGIGDTTDDENKRREDAEKAARDDRKA
jgi:hypothetical protein